MTDCDVFSLQYLSIVQDSMIHKFLFWVAIAILQLEDQRLYSAALAMLEQNLLTLDTHGVFETQVGSIFYWHLL